MKKLLLISLLAFTSLAFADDADIRQKLQTKYDAADAGLSSGNSSAYAKLCGSTFSATDVQKHSRNLAQYLKSLDRNGGRFSIQTHVESADTLDGKAKTALRITIIQNAAEGGRPVVYKSTRTQEDTWVQVGPDWKLVAARLTSVVVTRNGKTIASETEHVLTDWDRQYGHRSSSRRHHG